jgi:dynactin complex subunit
VVEEVERGVEKEAIEEKFLDEFQSNRFRVSTCQLRVYQVKQLAEVRILYRNCQAECSLYLFQQVQVLLTVQWLIVHQSCH